MNFITVRKSRSFECIIRRMFLFLKSFSPNLYSSVVMRTRLLKTVFNLIRALEHENMENPDGSLFVPAKCHCGKRCEHSFFRLGCWGNHPACIACFSKISASRGCNPNLKCLHCNEPVNTWDVLEVQVTITKKLKKARRFTRSASAKNDSSSSTILTEITIAKEIVIASDSIPEPRLEFEPTQYHHNLGYDMRVNAVVLAATYPEIIGDARTGRVKTLSVVMPSSSFDVDDTLSDSEKSKIEAIFRLLHTQIIGDLIRF